MKLEINLKDIFYLSTLFIILAVWFDIHGEKNVISFIMNHLLALILALIISKIIYIIMLHK